MESFVQLELSWGVLEKVLYFAIGLPCSNKTLFLAIPNPLVTLLSIGFYHPDSDSFLPDYDVLGRKANGVLGLLDDVDRGGVGLGRKSAFVDLVSISEVV